MFCKKISSFRYPSNQKSYKSERIRSQNTASYTQEKPSERTCNSGNTKFFLYFFFDGPCRPSCKLRSEFRIRGPTDHIESGSDCATMIIKTNVPGIWLGQQSGPVFTLILLALGGLLLWRWAPLVVIRARIGGRSQAGGRCCCHYIGDVA